MSVRSAALPVWLAALSVAHAAAAAEPLTLDDAFRRVATIHPELALIEPRRQALAAERDLADQRPTTDVGMELENALGTGAFNGLDGSEVTLHLGSVLERGGKAAARTELAQSRLDALDVDASARRLDLLAETARRYLAVSAARHRSDIATIDLAQRERTVTAARALFSAGASPESVVLSSEAAQARAQLQRDRMYQAQLAARQYLAAMWGEKDPDFDIAASDPLALPDIPEATALGALLEGAPELARFVTDRRIGEARVRLAHTAARADLQWQVGIKRLEANDDFALVAGVSLPLGAKVRAEPQLRGARAGLAELQVELEAARLSLYATLGEAHGRYRLAQLEVQQLGDRVLPALVRAEAAAEKAYRAGATGFLEWSQLQSDLTATRAQQLDAAFEARLALIEIQRLTGEPFVVDPRNE